MPHHEVHTLNHIHFLGSSDADLSLNQKTFKLRRWGVVADGRPPGGQTEAQGTFLDGDLWQISIPAPRKKIPVTVWRGDFLCGLVGHQSRIIIYGILWTMLFVDIFGPFWGKPPDLPRSFQEPHHDHKSWYIVSDNYFHDPPDKHPAEPADFFREASADAPAEAPIESIGCRLGICLGYFLHGKLPSGNLK